MLIDTCSYIFEYSPVCRFAGLEKGRGGRGHRKRLNRHEEIAPEINHHGVVDLDPKQFQGALIRHSAINNR